jgi:hypothetical protein
LEPEEADHSSAMLFENLLSEFNLMKTA